MSDLHRAVQTRVAAHVPPAVPPFEVLERRKRARDRRRYAVAGSALAVAAVALALGRPGGSGDRLVPPDAAGPPEEQVQQVFTVRPLRKSPYFADFGAGLQDCLALPGTSDQLALMSDPPQYRLTVTGATEIGAFEACVQGVPGYAAERREETVVQGYTPPRVEVSVEEPATAGQPVRIEAVIRDDRDVAVHRVQFGDGTEQIVRFLCVDASARAAPAGPQTHVVEHTWKEPGDYTVTFHYGPPCADPTSSVSHGVTVTR